MRKVMAQHYEMVHLTRNINPKTKCIMLESSRCFLKIVILKMNEFIMSIILGVHFCDPMGTGTCSPIFLTGDGNNNVPQEAYLSHSVSKHLSVPITGYTSSLSNFKIIN